MEATLASTAISSSNTTVKPLVGTLATIAPAFFLVGAGAIAYPDPAPEFQPAEPWVQYGNALSSRTKPALESLRDQSAEELVIAKLDGIFESLLASQRDLEPADQKAIAASLWNLYQ